MKTFRNMILSAVALLCVVQVNAHVVPRAEIAHISLDGVDTEVTAALPTLPKSEKYDKVMNDARRELQAAVEGILEKKDKSWKKGDDWLKTTSGRADCSSSSFDSTACSNSCGTDAAGEQEALEQQFCLQYCSLMEKQASFPCAVDPVKTDNAGQGR